MSIWCEHCRDHFPIDHYWNDGGHAVGAQYGPYGQLLAERSALGRVLEMLEDSTSDYTDIAAFIRSVLQQAA